MTEKIEAVVYEVLRNCGVHDADRLTQAVTDGLRRRYAGGWVYVDRGLGARNAAIRAALDAGHPPCRVATQYHLSPSQVYRIRGACN